MKHLLPLLLLASCAREPAEPHPLSAEEQSRLTDDLDGSIGKLSLRVHEEPRNVDVYSRRGDALFFRGRFAEAVADYEKMVELQPRLDAEHWRRGIAYFYAGAYDKAARQFEVYHTHDDVDRENGIWRFFSQAKAYGSEKARAGLLTYQKDDREPFPAVYQLFAGKTTAEAVLAAIRSADLKPVDREMRLFYAELYIGLNAAVEGDPRTARKHLRAAVANSWPRDAGFGPRYMWHVGRLHYEALAHRP